MKNTLLILSIFLFTSCLTFKLTDLKPVPKNQTLLPTLEPRVDMENLERIYNISPVRGTNTTISHTTDKEVSISTNLESVDPRLQDDITLFTREVRDNISIPYGDVKGTICFNIAAEDNNAGNVGFFYLSGFTFLIPNLFGMPFCDYHSALDVEVEIYNNSNRLVGRYNAQGYSKKWIALYYGYSPNSAVRLTNVLAFKEAMKDIKIQIDRDSDRLIKELQ